jgi:hypothetical protein
MESQSGEQLAIIAEARAAVADRLTTPRWYHPILGLLLAGYIVALSLGSTVVKAVAVVLFVAACGALASTYRRLTGLWISGFHAGRAGRWAKALGALVAVATATSWSIAYWTELTWPVWCLAAVAFVSAVVLGRRFDTALRAQLRAGV